MTGTITGLTNGQEYTLRAIATNAVGDSAGANSTHATPVAPVVAVTGVTVDPTEGSIAVGATVQVNATVAPENATDKAVTYASSDETKATVDAVGLVTGVAAGTADITVTSHADNTKTAVFTVTVTEA